MADRAGWVHGPTVDKKTRKLRYLSPSGLQQADMTTDKGCLRKWWYDKIEGKREPPTRQQAEGTADHAIVERYLATGERIFSPRAAKGIHMLPPPGPHLEIEHDMVPKLYECSGPHPDGGHLVTCKEVSGLALAPLIAADIPIVGRIDLMHDLGVNYGADDVENTQDPPGTVEVFDHKFTRSLDYAVKPKDMVTNIQMVAYGEYVFRTVPGVEYVRLSHGYYPTVGSARKSTIRTTREPLVRFWTEHVEPLARSMADAAKEPTADTVPANTNACKAFGRTCMHASYCSAGAQLGLSSYVGQTAANGLLTAIKNKDSNDMALIPGKGLLSHISKPATNDTAAREAELAKLKAEEAAAKAAAKKKLIPEGFDATITAIQAHDRGMPILCEDAAAAYAAYTDEDKASFDGSGDLAGVTLTAVAQFQDLLNELNEAFGAPETAKIDVETVGLVPEDSAPATAAPVEKPVATIAASADKPKKTRAKKIADAPVTETAETTVEVNISKAQEKYIEASAGQDTRVNLMVDVLAEGGEFKDFSVIVDGLATALAQRFGLDDCRMGDAQSPLGFGKWKGAIAAMIREGEIPPGTYRIDARGNEIYEEAVQAMRGVCRRTGGYFVRGIR